MNSALYATVKAASRYCRDVPTRQKLNWFLAALQEGNVQHVCARLGVVPKTYYFWWKRFKKSGFQVESLQARSRRPKRSPGRVKGKLLKWIRHYRLEYHYGPERIQLYLWRNHGLRVAQSTIGQVIKREGLRLRKNKKPPQQKHTKRYSLPWPGDCVQLDIKYVPKSVNQEQYYLYSAIDDCTRWRVSKVYRYMSKAHASSFLRHVVQMMPFPIVKVQVDNDSTFTYRLTPNCWDKRHPFESTAEELGLQLRFIPPGEKELNGKIERLHRTDDEEFFWKLPRNCPFALLQQQRELWSFEYNHYRYHKELGWKTPAEKLEERVLALLTLIAYILIKEQEPAELQSDDIPITRLPPALPSDYTPLSWFLKSIPSSVTHVSGYYIETAENFP